MHRWGESLCRTTRWHLLCATLSQGETRRGLWDTRSTWEEHARALAVDPDQPLPAGGPCLMSSSPGPDAEAALSCVPWLTVVLFLVTHAPEAYSLLGRVPVCVRSGLSLF